MTKLEIEKLTRLAVMLARRNPAENPTRVVATAILVTTINRKMNRKRDSFTLGNTTVQALQDYLTEQMHKADLYLQPYRCRMDCGLRSRQTLLGLDPEHPLPPSAGSITPDKYCL